MDVMGVIAGCLLLVTLPLQAHRERKRKRRGQRALQVRPERRAAEIADGEVVRVQGLSVAERSLVGPLSGRPCIGYCVAVEERADFTWRQIRQREEFVPFRIAVDGTEWHVEGPFVLTLKIDTRGDRVGTPSPSEAKVLEELGVSLRDFLNLKRNLRLLEARVEQNDVIWVSGHASIDVDPRGQPETLRGQPIRRTIRGTPAEPTVLADELDGRVRDLV